MPGFDSINLSISYPALLYVLLLIILGIAGILYYRRTVPDLPRPLKITLTALRVLVLLIVLTVLFEPVARIIRREKLNPVNLVFIDNSKSLSINENGFNRPEITGRLLEELKNSGLNNTYYLFGAGVTNATSPQFKEPNTDFGLIFNQVTSSKQNIASVTVISDGVITRGSGSFRPVEKLNIPFYTVLVGDSIPKRDVRVDRIITNDLIYAGVSSPLFTDISAAGFEESEVRAMLYEENTLLEEKSGVINGGSVRVRFDYQPKSAGEKKLTVRVSPLRNEAYANNNSQTVYVNILSGKIKIAVIGGSPSSDISAISNSLSADTNFTVKSIIHIGNGKYIPKNFNLRDLDSSSILVLNSFPEKDTPQDLVVRVSEMISNRNTPFLLILSPVTDQNKLSSILPSLPVELSGTGITSTDVQAVVNGNELSHPVISGLSESAGWNWNSLPPLTQPAINFKPRAGSVTLLFSSVRNIRTSLPLFSVMRTGSKRSAMLTANNIWRWKLNQPGNNFLFDNFMVNTVKWLNAVDDRKQVKIFPVKKLFASGEPVEFVAEVYDESFNPLSGASVNVELRSSKGIKSNFSLTEIENGIYEGRAEELSPSDYTFKGVVTDGNTVIGTESGRFNIGDLDIEMVNPGTDPDYLKRLSTLTGGRSFYNDDTEGLIDLLRRKEAASVKEKTTVDEFDVWTSNFLLILVIVFLGVEWFLRKREGMI